MTTLPSSARDSVPLTVNFHLWQPCNMRCKFCYAQFTDVVRDILPKGHLKMEDSLQIVERLAESGFTKITFAGGEPLLCPWLGALILAAKRAGLVTNVVTNGSKMTADWLSSLAGSLDWVTLSVDSLRPEVNARIGRVSKGQEAMGFAQYLELGELIQQAGIKLKVNTVVSAYNLKEDISALIQQLRPIRWKVLQALPIEGQNDRYRDEFQVTQPEFLDFLARHASLDSYTKIVPEEVEDIKGSYYMVDPAGRFFDNTSAKHFYSRPILEVGADVAMSEVKFSLTKYIGRGGNNSY